MANQTNHFKLLFIHLLSDSTIVSSAASRQCVVQLVARSLDQVSSISFSFFTRFHILRAKFLKKTHKPGYSAKILPVTIVEIKLDFDPSCQTAAVQYLVATVTTVQLCSLYIIHIISSLSDFVKIIGPVNLTL